MQTLAFILSILGTVCTCVPALLKGKNMTLILLLVFLSNALVAASYFLTGATSGAAICCVGALQSIINFIFERKNKALPVWLIVVYGAMFVVIDLLVYTQIFDIITLVAALMFVMGISAKSGKRFRMWTLLNVLLWITYDLFTRSYGPLMTHGIQLATVLFGILVHDRKEQTTE